MNDSRYADIPSCGVSLIDSIQHHFGDEALRSTVYRQSLGDEFRQVCRRIARNNQLSQDERKIWVRAAINSINKSYVIADAMKDYGCTNLTAEFCAILESEFLQITEPICVKRVAMEIGAMEIFEEKIMVGLHITYGANGNIIDPVSDVVSDGPSLHLEYLCLFQLNIEMGVTGEFYQKKICLSCDVQDCPYDVYWRMLQSTGEANEKYRLVTHEEATASQAVTPRAFPSLSGPLSSAQPYLEALYPDYMDENLKWKKKKVGVTNYHAYWVARILIKKFPEISIQMVGDYFGINNLRHYSTEARLREGIKQTFLSVFRSNNLDAPDPE